MGASKEKRKDGQKEKLKDWYEWVAEETTILDKIFETS